MKKYVRMQDKILCCWRGIFEKTNENDLLHWHTFGFVADHTRKRKTSFLQKKISVLGHSILLISILLMCLSFLFCHLIKDCSYQIISSFMCVLPTLSSRSYMNQIQGHVDRLYACLYLTHLFKILNFSMRILFNFVLVLLHEYFQNKTKQIQEYKSTRPYRRNVRLVY